VKGEKVTRSSEVKPELLVSAMVMVFVFGLVAITMLLGVMKAELNFSVGQILAFALLNFLILLSIASVAMRKQATQCYLRGTQQRNLTRYTSEGCRNPCPA
jgi:hypothetical protein